MTDGRYPDGDPYGRGVADEVYGTGNHTAYPAYDAYDTGANAAYGANAYDSDSWSGSWQTGGHQTPAYPQESYPAGAGQNGYDPSLYGTSPVYGAATDDYGHDSGAYTAFSYDGSGAYAAVDTGGSGAYAAVDVGGSGAYAAVDTGGSGAYAAVDASGGYPAYDSGAYQAYGADGTYGQATAAVPQADYPQYEQTAWSGDVLTAVQEQPGTWASEAWSTDGTAATGWYDTATAVQAAPAPALDRHDAPAWDASPAPHLEGADPFAGTQEFALGFAAHDTGGTAVAFAPGEAFDTDGRTDEFADHAAHSGSSDAPAPHADGHPDSTMTAEFSVAAVRDAVRDEDDGYDDESADDDEPDGAAAAAAAVGAPRTISASAASSRAARRKTTRRTRPMVKVAGGSLGVLGAAAMAVAAAGGIQADTPNRSDDTIASGVDVPLASSPLDQQFTQLQESAEDFADRASRTQARVALEEKQAEIARQQAEQARIQAEQAKLAEEERVKKEQERPKFMLPVRPGLSAYFGQAGGRWSSLHTGIDFPVSTGTSVRAVTDGVVRTQWNSAYGNMVILTAPDGTETWYCHLSRAKVVSGPVKAGDVIAYSGNTGNSTGPHLHLEVRPGGGAPVNPIPWLRNKGLDPT
ncbi:peptidoglycan DD-metalloendopeptidase family protein [Yinghuangia sp. ASG 101]|uniref:M23 family metallopeptidase n=1 Tax=Yinghuangia sp. ASG 101 TaxID=2896848 RepID=UPI001E41323B|nr:M23 family metallopeptidase [Yinghuangia sp. ASG 101]UGQ14550.1 peptidoglycan DD-metalloendopeptidase family protein [Yinghuangia sp. ASG 101]